MTAIIAINQAVAEFLFGFLPGRPTISERTGALEEPLPRSRRVRGAEQAGAADPTHPGHRPAARRPLAIRVSAQARWLVRETSPSLP